MTTKKTPARRRRLFEDVLNAMHILTDLRRDLHVFCSTTLGLHTVLGRVPSDPKKSYLKGMHKVAEDLQQLLRKPRKPAWQERWAEESRQRKAEIARIQRRPDQIKVSLLPEPEDSQDLDRFLRMSRDAEQLEKLDKKRVALLRKLKKCDVSTEGGQFGAEAILAEIEENDNNMNSLEIDMAVDWVVALRKGAERSPKGEVRAIPHCEHLMLAYNEAARKASAYLVSSTTEETGRAHLEKATGAKVVAVYATWQEAARFGLDWQAAPRFTVTEYTSGEVECSFDVDLS